MAPKKKEAIGPSAPAPVWARPDTDHKTDFRDLLLWMVDQGNRAWGEETPTASPKLYNAVTRHLNGNWRQLDAKELELGFSEGEFPIGQNGASIPCVVMRAPRPNVLPVLAPQFVFARNKVDRYPELRLHVAVFYEDELGSDIRVLGYRFEPPEGPGMHDYVHFQYINGLGGRGDIFADHLGSGFPLDVPAWPLWVDSPASMLAAVYVGLYGVKDLPIDQGVRRIFDKFVRGRLIVSPHFGLYKFHNCPELSSAYVRTWAQQVRYIERRVETLYQVKGVTLVPVTEEPKGIQRKDLYELAWTDDLPKGPGL